MTRRPGRRAKPVTLFLALILLLLPARAAWADQLVHVVQPGETLFLIGLRYNLDWHTLMHANGLASTTIYVGQRLIIPTGGDPGSPPAAADDQIHLVQPGETLFLIGLRYNLNWQSLMAYNGLPGTRIYVGQRLLIPAAGSSGSASAAAQAPAETGAHIVQPGETLFSIGLRYNLTWDAMMRANGLTSTRIIVGQRLIIPGRAGQAPASQPAAGSTRYTVVAGDTLWHIARRFGVTVSELITLNGLPGSGRVYAGQVLTIPGGAAAGAPGVRLPVSGRLQSLPLDCEARSAVDWAGYFGYAIDELDFFGRLPASDDPDAGFVGSVYGAWGQVPPAPYGVHAEPVAAALNGYGVAATAMRNLAWESMRGEIDANRPVIAWVVGHVIGGSPLSYTASNGHTTVVAAYEHTVIVIGYGDDSVTVLDGSQVYSRPLAQFLASWAVLGNMAIVR